MSKQVGMEDFLGDKIVSYGEPHMACALLLDVSGSMYGQAIGSLNKAIHRFKEQVLADSVARNRVDVAIITFGEKVELISDFVPITEMPTPKLIANGRTEMAGGIEMAIDLVKQRTQLYHTLGTPCHKPWIFMITDGAATSSSQDMAAAAERIRPEEGKGSHGHLAFWALGIDDYDPSQLFTLTDRVVELKDQDFSTIFNWLSESMSTISQSHVGEYVELNDLPPNARKAQQDRAIDKDWF